MTVTGSCFCGSIQFRFEAPADRVVNCHCANCRKSHGAAFATLVIASRSTLEFLQGRELLAEFRSEIGIRAFCSSCGSRLMNYAPAEVDGPAADYLAVSLAAVDEGFSGRPRAHAFVGSKADWHDPSSDIPSFTGYPGR